MHVSAKTARLSVCNNKIKLGSVKIVFVFFQSVMNLSDAALLSLSSLIYFLHLTEFLKSDNEWHCLLLEPVCRVASFILTEGALCLRIDGYCV